MNAGTEGRVETKEKGRGGMPAYTLSEKRGGGMRLGCGSVNEEQKQCCPLPSYVIVTTFSCEMDRSVSVTNAFATNCSFRSKRIRMQGEAP